MEDTKELNNWWPGPISWIAAEKPLASEQVIVAEIGHPNGPHSHRHLYTALVPPKQLEKVLNHRGGIGHKVDNTSISISPKFWIWGGSEAEYLEPLVLAWEAANTTVLQLDPHFLMSYHLVPRIVPDGSVHWG